MVLPFRFNRAELFLGNFSYQGVARLKPGATIEQANADVARLIPTLYGRFKLPPGFTREMFEAVRLGPLVRPLTVDVVGDIGGMLWILFGTVGIVLLVACANVANLFLVRAEGRQQELAVRMALGAGTRRVARELLAESLLLGVFAGALGVALAYAGIRLLVYLQPAQLPRLAEITLDPVVLVFTLVLSIAAGLLFGVIPVLKYARPQLANALKENGRGVERRARAPSRPQRARRIAGGARGRAACRLRADGADFHCHAQCLARIRPAGGSPDDAHLDPVGRHQQRSTGGAHARADRAATSKPSAVFSRSVCPRRSRWTASATTTRFSSRISRARWAGPAAAALQVIWQPATSKRWAIRWSPAARSRGPTSTPHAPVVMVSENLAREFWGDPAKAVGRRMRNTPRNPWREIVGVVGNERQEGVTQPAPTIVYWPI